MVNDQTGTTSSAKADWRGQSEGERPVHHRWQQSAAAAPGLRNGRLKAALKAGVWLFLVIAAGFAFAWMMRFQPRQTPVVTLCFTRYEAPLFPNVWAFEDRESLQPLNGVTLQLYDIADQGNADGEVLREFQKTMRTAAAEFHDTEPLVVSLSGHVGVTDDHAPCLLTSASSIPNVETWLPLKSLLLAAQEARRDVQQPILFLLDVRRFATALDAVTRADQFHDALEQLIAASEIRNLTLICACGPRQRSYASPQHQQTVFGYALQQALSGAADRAGNDDQYVSLSELLAYLKQQVAHAAQTALGRPQDVLVLQPTGAVTTDYTVCWVPGRQTPEGIPPVVMDTPVDLASLWKAFETARQGAPWNDAPRQWGALEADLLRLQEMVHGGAACQVQATALAERLARQLSSMSPSNGSRSSGTAAPGQLATSASAEKLGEAATADELADRLAAIEPNSSMVLRPELHLATRIARQPDASFWKQPGLPALALQARQAADQTGRSVAPEALPWVEAAVGNADQVRLRAEDEMFAGTDSSERFRTAITQYESSVARLNSTASALQSRNQALATILWFSRLYAEQDKSTLEQLAEFTSLLTVALHTDDKQHSNAASLPFENANRDVQTGLQRLQQRLDQEYETLLKQPATSAATLARMQQLLGTPLLPSPSATTGESGAEQRMRLHRRMQQTVARRIAAPDLATDLASTAVASSQSWQRVLIQLTASLDGADSRQTELRPQVLKLPGRVRTAVTATEPTVHNYRAPLLRLSSHLRILSPMALFSEQDDSVTALQQLDRTLIRVWQARRSLNDFYGPLQPAELPFFARSAEHYLRGGQSSLTEAAAVQNQILQVGRQLNQRLQGASSGLQVDAHHVLLMEQTQLEPMTIKVTRNHSLPAEALPSGIAAIYLADDQQQRRSNLLSMTVDPDAPDAEERPSFTGGLLVQDVAEAGPGRLDATVNLRGNLFRQNILVSRAAGPATLQKITNSAQVSINVVGAATADTSAIVIFDCSQSMSEAMAAETPGRQVTRFQAARQALLHLMQQMAELDGFRVGLMLFGHRVGWNPEQPEQLLTQDQYLNGVPVGLRPYEDVETLLPVGRFDPAVLQGILPALQTVRPWGETPLYLAISEAVAGLSTEDPRRDKRIIVVTDGTNQQVNPTLAKRRTVTDVLQSLPKGVRIDIIGFRIADAEAALAAQEFDALTSHSGGQFISVSAVDELMRSLSGLIRQEDFELTAPDQSVQVSPPGQAISLQVDQGPSVVRVRLADATEDLTLYGGETVDLQLSSDRQALKVVPGETDRPHVVPLHHSSGTKSPLVCSVDRLLLDQQTVRLRGTLSHDAGEFLPRPASAQAFVYPLNKEQQRVGAGYAADIVHWNNHTSVPQFEVELSRWPVSATQAELQIQVQDQPAAPVDSIPLVDLHDDGHLVTAKKTLDDVNGIEAFVIASKDYARISVVQKHAAASPGLDSVIVRVRSAGDLQQRIRRTDAAQRLVVTVFEYSPENPPGLATGWIEFILQEDLKHDALRFENPVRLPVSVSSGLLLPTAR